LEFYNYFIGCTDFKNNTTLIAFRDLFIIKEDFVYPFEFFEDEELKNYLDIDYLRIEDWFIFHLIGEIKDISEKIRVLEVLKEKKVNFEKFKIKLRISSLDSLNIYFFKIELLEENLTQDDFLDLILKKIFFKLGLITEYDFLPIMKLFEAQKDLNLPFVHYETEENIKCSFLIYENSILSFFKFPNTEKYEEFEEKVNYL
jgi:hypothetical protein